MGAAAGIATSVIALHFRLTLKGHAYTGAFLYTLRCERHRHDIVTACTVCERLLVWSFLPLANTKHHNKMTEL